LKRRQSLLFSENSNLPRKKRKAENFAQPDKTSISVIPVKAGIQHYQWLPGFTLTDTIAGMTIKGVLQ